MLRGSRGRLASTAGLNPSLYTGGTQPEAMFGDGTGGKPPAPPVRSPVQFRARGTRQGRLGLHAGGHTI